jgi:hypothetical protein
MVYTALGTTLLPAALEPGRAGGGGPAMAVATLHVLARAYYRLGQYTDAAFCLGHAMPHVPLLTVLTVATTAAEGGSGYAGLPSGFASRATTRTGQQLGESGGSGSSVGGGGAATPGGGVARSASRRPRPALSHSRSSSYVGAGDEGADVDMVAGEAGVADELEAGDEAGDAERSGPALSSTSPPDVAPVAVAAALASAFVAVGTEACAPPGGAHAGASAGRHAASASYSLCFLRPAAAAAAAAALQLPLPLPPHLQPPPPPPPAAAGGSDTTAPPQPDAAPPAEPASLLTAYAEAYGCVAAPHGRALSLAVLWVKTALHAGVLPEALLSASFLVGQMEALLGVAEAAARAASQATAGPRAGGAGAPSRLASPASPRDGGSRGPRHLAGVFTAR